jgi:predicted glutamine amidotransferase
MCRLFALSSRDPVSPMRAIKALNVMKEGHDGSGVGLFLHDLGGPFGEIKDAPILSGIFTDTGLKRLDTYMDERGFFAKSTLVLDPRTKVPDGTPLRGTYMARAYQVPANVKAMPREQRELTYLLMRVELRTMGQADEDIRVFSFWPDTIMVKEVGDPLAVGEYLGLDRPELFCRHMLAQGRQNTNYAINLYACHPFFIQGVCTMTNGENTAFIPIKEYLESRGFPGYVGYQSDSEVFTHIMHFTLNRLHLGVEYYKHIITPLSDAEMEHHTDRELLRRIKQTCRKLIIDGPNCVIGCLPDGTMFMAQDRKKLRPGVVGGVPGLFAFSSEICGLDAAIPDRDQHADFQPMHLDTAIVRPECQEVTIWNQMQSLPRQH